MRQVTGAVCWQYAFYRLAWPFAGTCADLVKS